MTGKGEKEKRGRGEIEWRLISEKVFRLFSSSPLLLFFLPILAAVAIFAFLNLSCQSQDEKAAGSLKLLYTSEVGGKLDPCG